jgi:hypothetical protein
VRTCQLISGLATATLAIDGVGRDDAIPLAVVFVIDCRAFEQPRSPRCCRDRSVDCCRAPQRQRFGDAGCRDRRTDVSGLIMRSIRSWSMRCAA